jgi:hypothetical protein
VLIFFAAILKCTWNRVVEDSWKVKFPQVAAGNFLTIDVNGYVSQRYLVRSLSQNCSVIFFILGSLS